MLDATLPQLVADSYSFRSNGSTKQIDVLANDAPDDSGSLLIETVSQGSLGGFVQIGPDGRTLTYRPFPGASGVETFRYAVTGGFATNVRVKLRSPVESDRFVVDEQSGPTLLRVMENDDLGSRFAGERSITAVSFPSHGGTVEIAEDGISVWYTPNPDFSGTEIFEYVVGEQVSGQVRVDVRRLLKNDSLAREDEVLSGIPKTFDVLANDPFADDYAGERRITLVTDPAHGTAELNPRDGSITYTSTPGFSGYEQFHYVVDGQYEATVSFAVTPLTSNDYLSVMEGAGETALDVLSNDRLLTTPGSDAVLMTDFTQPTEGGSLRLADDGSSLLYQPAAGFTGWERATYTLNEFYEASVTFYVSAWPETPDVSVVANQGVEEVQLPVSSSAFFTPYGGPGIITGLEQGSHGSVTIAANGRDLLYRPDPGFSGTDTVTFTIDGNVEGAASIRVTPLAEGERIRAVISPDFDDIELNVLANDLHIADATITSIAVPEDIGVMVRISEDGRRIVLTPEEMRYRSFNLEYTLNGLYTTTASVALYPSVRTLPDRSGVQQNSTGTVIDPIANDRLGNATPTVYDWILEEHVPSVFSYGGPREITAVSPTRQGGDVSITADGKHLVYQPAADFAGTDSFEYTVDGQWVGTVSVNVTRAVRDDTASVLADGNANPINVLANDPLGTDYAGAGLITQVTQPASGGTATIADDGSAILYTAPDGFTGEDTFEYRVDDTQVATVTVQVGQTIDDLLQRFQSINEFREWLIDEALARHAGSFGRPYLPVYLAFDGQTGSPTAASERVFSETNVQVAGVDEADLVENDGEHLYLISGRDLIVARAWPVEELSEVARLRLDGTPLGMYLHEGRLTVISETVEYEDSRLDPIDVSLERTIDVAPLNDNAPTPEIETGERLASSSADSISPYWPIWPGPQITDFSTVVTIFDVSTPSDPQLVRQTTVDSRYNDSRSVDGTLHLLTQRGGIRLPSPEPVPLSESDPLYDELLQDGWNIDEDTKRYETQAEYLARIEESFNELIAEMFPQYWTVAADGTETTGSLVDPGDLIQLGEDASQLLSVVSLKTDSDLASPIATQTLLTSVASTVYATRDHLYVLGAASESETGIDRSEDGHATQIRRFDWDNDIGGIELSAIGAVPGRPTDEFALDEFEGRLRIATKTRRTTVTGSRQVTDLYVLGATSGQFTTVGTSLDIARGDALKSVRFHGDIAVAATFDGSSPLHVLDLSNPESPSLAGQILTVGYPSYMQYVGEGRLLTIGRNSAARVTGPTQVSLLDLTDPLNPGIIDQDTLPEFSSSVAETDHHAFGWFGYHSVLAVPTSRLYSVRTDEDGDGYRESRETRREDTLYAFQVDTSVSSRSEDGIRLNGTVEHDAAILRSAFIDDVLYSIGDGKIRAVDIHDPSVELATAELAHSPVEILVPEIWRTVALDAAEFQLASVQADVIAPPEATIEIVNRVLEIDLTDIPAADASVLRDRQTGELVVRYRSTTLDTQVVEQRFALRDVGKIRATLGSGNDRLDLSRAFRRSTVFGGAGNDSLIGGARYDELHGQAGDDILQGRRGVDLLFGEDGNDQLYGQQYNDWMYGGAGNDTLLGNDGNDVINGGTGADFLNGGRGQNRLTDQIDGNVTLAAAGYDTGRGDVARGIGASGRLEIIGGDGSERIDASAYRGGGVVLNGGGGDDTLIGSRGDDSLDGGAGGDVIRGGAGHDTLFGNLGNDRLLGQGGIDELGGGLGNDRIDGGGGVSIIREQADTDYSLSGDRDAVRTDGLGTDRWIGRFVRALLHGGESDNQIDASGFAEPVRIFGGGGNDILNMPD